MPAKVLDLFVEFRNLTNGLPVPCGNGLLGALAYYGLDAIDVLEKTEMRDLAIRGGQYTESEKVALLDYCQSDVDALARLLQVMQPKIDLPRALVRGRYMVAAARMEHCGVPIDQSMLARLQEHWETIKSQLIGAVDADYGVYQRSDYRQINPNSTFGYAILKTAENWEIDAQELVIAVDYVWREHKDSTEDFYAAKRRAREITGLTPARVSRWENGLLDHSTYPGLDTQARELADQYPQLGLGRGFGSDSGYDRTDYAGLLWEILRDRQDRPRPRHDSEILETAGEMVCRGDALVVASLPQSFNAVRFARWLTSTGIPWPRLDGGQLALDDETFRQMARRHPEVAPLRELRHTLGQLRLHELSVGSDSRNRCLLSVFRARTGRNQPSNSKFIFGPSAWLRSLIKPGLDRAIAYVDWSQQEFGIAASFSGDTDMQQAYLSGDPYLSFAKQAGAVPEDATKQSHPEERSQFKVCALAVQYGMGQKSLSESLGEPEIVGRELLRLHRRTYPQFWQWSESAVDHAMLYRHITTVFGWTLHVGPNVNPRSVANFPCQANGAEMLRLACCLATERGIQVCAPIHDALLVEGPIDEIGDVVDRTQTAMRDASEIVLDGFALRTDAEIVRYPDRYSDPRGVKMWETVTEILDELDVPSEVPF
jgi:hypothetical protein